MDSKEASPIHTPRNSPKLSPYVGVGLPGTFIQRTSSTKGRHDVNTIGQAVDLDPKLVVVMVGLPARGKSFIVKKLKRYLQWLGFFTKIFNVGDRRRTVAAREEQNGGQHVDHDSKFFDPDNVEAHKLRDQLAMDSLDELIQWLKDENGKVGIHDATNSTIARRRMILDRCAREENVLVMFVESICTDEKLIAENINMKVFGPDYRHTNPVKAVEDFCARLANYERAYQTIGEEEEQQDVQFCKIINVGKKVIAHNIQGYLSGQCVFYLMNVNLAKRKVWITRHGESLDNIVGKIGGDAPLSAHGHKYAADLARFMDTQVEIEREVNPCRDGQPPSFCVWTSMLRRAMQTAEDFDPQLYDIKHIRALNEIYAGQCEGMTYTQILQQYPNEYEARQNNKLYYRYPGMGGESYVDVIQRVNHVIVELERMTANVLIVTHQALMRTLVAYMMDIPLAMMPNIVVPLNQLYCIEPQPYGNKVTLYWYDPANRTFTPQ